MDTTNEKDLSFLFISKDFFDNIFSYYYFRVLFLKKDEEIKYLPIDSNLGNLCIPERTSDIDPYYCYLILKNNYDELNNIKFAVSSVNQNEFVEINVTINNGTSEIEKNASFVYLYDNNEITNNVKYILFKFGFQDNETKTIISSFCDRIETIYPHVYSGQMYYLENFTKINNFKMENTYFLKYQFIFGDDGVFGYTIYEIDKIYISENFKGKPIIIQLDKNLSSIPFSTNKTKHIFYYQLINKMKIQGAEEITVGEPLTQIIVNYTLPLYFYLKIKSKEYINIDVNIRLKDYMDSELNAKFNIKGYIIDDSILYRKINGEYIKLENPIIGNYSDIFGIGFLQVNQEIDKGSDKYLLIEIDSENKFHSFISLMEISAKEYDENNNDIEYMLPINKYIIESFNGRNGVRSENKYYIYIPEGNSSQTWIELSTDYDDIKLKFDNKSLDDENENKNEKGFKKYKIKKTENRKITFEVTNKQKRATNYLIRYSYHDNNNMNSFIFNGNYSENRTDKNNTFDVNFTFNCIEMKTESDLIKKNGVYYFITGTLYKANKDNTTNSSYILNVIDSIYVNKLINLYIDSAMEKNWTLEFKDFPKDNTDKYELQLQIQAVLLDNILNEEYLLYKINVDLDNPKEQGKNPAKPKNTWKWIVATVVIATAIIISLIFLIKFLRLKKKNDNFQKEMKSILFSNDIQKNVLIKEQQISKNESDFESTFI